MKNVWDCAEWCEEESSIFLVQREEEDVLPILLVVAARSGEQYVPSVSTEGAVLERIVFQERVTEK